MKKIKKSWNINPELDQLKHWKYSGAKAALMWLDEAYWFACASKKSLEKTRKSSNK